MFIVEVKSNPKRSDIDEFLEKYETIKTVEHLHQNKEIILLFAGFNVRQIEQSKLIAYSSENNVYFIIFKDYEYLEIVNFDELKINKMFKTRKLC